MEKEAEAICGDKNNPFCSNHYLVNKTDKGDLKYGIWWDDSGLLYFGVNADRKNIEIIKNKSVNEYVYYGSIKNVIWDQKRAVFFENEEKMKLYFEDKGAFLDKIFTDFEAFIEDVKKY